MAKYFKCTTDKDALSYKCGETITFTVRAREKARDIDCPYLRWTIQTDDGQKREGYGRSMTYEPLTVTASMSRPGFVRLTVHAFAAGWGVDNSFDVLEAGAGVEPEKLTYCDTVPEDFDEYWGEIEQLVADFPCECISSVPVTAGVREGFKAYDIRISTPEGRPASGILTLPDKEGKFPLHLGYAGYAVAGIGPVCADDAIMLMLNAHGIENEGTRFEMELKYKADIGGYGFKEDENEDKYKTYWRGMMIRDLIGAKYAKTLPQWDGKTVTCVGGSQGALQATTVAAHDKDVTGLQIGVPWFCNLNAENCGYMGGWRPKFAEGLRYFDQVAQATRVTCPVKVHARLGDYICPPSTTMTLYNTFNTVKALEMLQAGTHGYTSPEDDFTYRRYDPKNPTGEIKVGRYRHYKGGEYQVLGHATHSETGEDLMVYKALYGDEKTWVRPARMFLEYVRPADEWVQRFQYIGE